MAFQPSDGSFQVYNSQIEATALQFLQRVPPDVIGAQRAWYRSCGFLSKSDILTRIAHIRLIEDWTYGMRQRLINAASGHYITA